MKMISENEVRKLIRDYANGEMTIEEVSNQLDLAKCPICGNYELEEDMVNHKGDIGNMEEKICQDCKENE